jgi:glycosyltransferase involved in cell wall biosynthesis
MPAYNAEKWIKDSIKSALFQTWPKKEIIIVNDGSLDNTLAIAKQFESKSLKVISQENRGASAARNKAYSFAQGDYIQYLDADDLLAPDKISAQMKVAENGQTSLTLYSSSHGVFYWRLEKAKFIPDLQWQDLTPVEWMIQKFFYNLWMSPAAYLVSRRLAEKGGGWDERLCLNDDGEYFCRVVAASERVKFVREARCYYRRSGFHQLSLQSSEKACKSLFLSWTLSIQYLRSLEESERTRRAGLVILEKIMPRFYPQKSEVLEEVYALALALGGELNLPRFGWKFNLVQRLLGWKSALTIMPWLRKLRLAIDVKWDEMLYRIQRASRKDGN